MLSVGRHSSGGDISELLLPQISFNKVALGESSWAKHEITIVICRESNDMRLWMREATSENSKSIRTGTLLPHPHAAMVS